MGTAPMAFDRKCLDAGRSCRPGRCPSRVWMTVTPALRAAASTFLQVVTQAVLLACHILV